MKSLTKACASLFVLLTFAVVLHASDKDVLRDALTTKFAKSSKGVVQSVSVKDGHVQIVAGRGGIGDDNNIVIDTAVALNRANDGMGKWTKVSVTVSKTTYGFTRSDFDAYRSGKLNDGQFLKRTTKKKG